MSETPEVRVAMFHTRYREPGGEDLSTRQETELLRRRGVPIESFLLSNEEALGGGVLSTAATLWSSSYSRRTYAQVRRFCRRHRPTVAHVQNFWLALSPSVHRACHDEGVATVQTLRNYRLLCVNGLLMRQGAPCERCVGRAPWPGVALACYHDSRLHSALVARMIVSNRLRRTWERDVDVLVALTRFARDRFVAGGLPADRLVVKPNFVADPGPSGPPGHGALYLGRLAAEKGVDTIVEAWSGAAASVPLEILGDGPEAERVRQAAGRVPSISWLGHRPPEEVARAFGRCGFLVMASRWYEGFPRVLVEAMAHGRPALVPRLGSMAEVVEDGRTGLHFTPGDAADLAAQARRLAADEDLRRRLGRQARLAYEREYSEDRGFEQAMEVYRLAIGRFSPEVSGNRLSPDF